jgi:DNA (cytosine-5)-methyltransferase 1
MEKLKVLDLFSGIGGFSLGLERTGGFETVAFCEIEPFPRRVLAKHWPGVPIYEDVRQLRGKDVGTVDVICGGFPCQDLSAAGNQAGLSGDRSGLWSEITRLIDELRPNFVIVENVAAVLTGPSEQPGGWYGSILRDLAERGYDAEWQNFPAGALGAPHERQRWWAIAYPNQVGTEIRYFEIARRSLSRDRLESVARTWRGSKPSFVRMGNGVPSDVDRIGACGNSVVPQIPELIGHAILASIRESEAA